MTARELANKENFGAYRAALQLQMAKRGKTPAEIRAAVKALDEKSKERRSHAKAED